MLSSQERVERELTLLVRRAQKVPLHADSGLQTLDRAAYGILGRLFDEGPLRLSALATVFGLDRSTITRQAQSLEHAGLVDRAPDPADGRACLLELTETGRVALERTRELRRTVVTDLLAGWSPADRATFAELLERFNRDLAERRPDLLPHSPGAPATAHHRKDSTHR